MGKRLESISSDLKDFIQAQKMFFVATAMEEGRINLSPKGMDSLRVLDDNRVLWLNLTGSGNETAAHLLHKNRITIMFCAFEGKPMILRLFGTAKVYHERDREWSEYVNLFPDLKGKRQIIDVEVDLVQTSCGFAVPLMGFQADRKELKIWAEKKGPEQITAYQLEKNTESLDGHPTGILE